MRIIHLIAICLAFLVPLTAFAGDEEAAADAADTETADTGKAKLELGDANVDPGLECTVATVDGKSTSGTLTHVFRGSDWYGNDPEKNSGIAVSADVNLFDTDWKNIKSISVSRPNTSSDMDCYSDEDKDPILWECTLKQVSSVRMREKHEYSGTYKVDTRETFTFVFDNDVDTAVTFRLYKLVANTQHYESMSTAIADLQTELKNQNRISVKTITFK